MSLSSKGGDGERRRGNALGLVVLKLDMQTVLNPNFHLDRIVRIRRHPVGMYPEVFLFDYVCHSAREGDADEVPFSPSTKRAHAVRLRSTKKDQEKVEAKDER